MNSWDQTPAESASMATDYLKIRLYLDGTWCGVTGGSLNPLGQSEIGVVPPISRALPVKSRSTNQAGQNKWNQDGCYPKRMAAVQHRIFGCLASASEGDGETKHDFAPTVKNRVKVRWQARVDPATRISREKQ